MPVPGEAVLCRRLVKMDVVEMGAEKLRHKAQTPLSNATPTHL